MNLVEQEKVRELELLMLQEEQIEIPVKHTFSKGIYAREITIPKGCLLLGHEHKVDCLNILSKGILLLTDQASGEAITVESPATFESKAGVRKLGYAVEECVFINVFHTNETDIDKLEELLIVKSDTFLESNKGDEICHS